MKKKTQYDKMLEWNDRMYEKSIENRDRAAMALLKTEVENPKEAIGQAKPLGKITFSGKDLAGRGQFDTNRKHYPVDSGCFKYFPNALKYVSHVSWVGNEQHNPGTPLHWDRNKSQDDADARARHILGDEYDVDGVLEEGKAAWRSLAVLEKKLEALGFKI